MSLRFMVYKTPPTWLSIFDNTKLENKNGGFSWTGSSWQSNPLFLGEVAQLKVKTGEMWDQGFRPTKVRITWNSSGAEFGQGTWDLVGKDSADATIFSDPQPATVTAELDITWGANDFEYFSFQLWGADPTIITITNVEWYGYAV